MEDLIVGIIGALVKAAQAPAEERAKIIADELAQHATALAALGSFVASGNAAQAALESQLAELKLEHDALKPVAAKVV